MRPLPTSSMFHPVSILSIPWAIVLYDTHHVVAAGGVDAYLDAFPGELQTVNKWQMSDQDMAGPDLSDLVNGVDTRQAGQRYY